MQTLLSIVKWLLIGLVGLFLLLILGSTLNHRIRSPREAAAYPPPGQLVAVNGNRLQVYAEGTGDPTLVFLAGGPRAGYVPWTEVERIDFDRPPGTYPPT